MLFGVSGNCDDREVTSLPDELPREPDSEKDTCGGGGGETRHFKKHIHVFFIEPISSTSFLLVPKLVSGQPVTSMRDKIREARQAMSK